ncbi:MAG: hypothetical protein IKV32_04480 [Muribaculaceae bacterium]|nr:hypothetical protein [Muribaculaceae bacterium]
MGRKVITLTESELKENIYNAVIPMLNEIEAKTYAIVHQATKQKANDDIITQGIDLERKVMDAIINPYKNIRYMFYCHNLRKNTGIVLFQLDELYELTNNKIVLKGDVIFNNKHMNGSIIVDMQTLNVVYHHNLSRKKYPLEIDNRFAVQWDNLCSILQQLKTKLLF